MLYFQERHYAEIADEVIRGENGCCGAVELTFGEFEIIFGFDAAGSLDRWILICFENGIRCGSDFDIENLKTRLQWL